MNRTVKIIIVVTLLVLAFGIFYPACQPAKVSGPHHHRATNLNAN